MENYPPLELDDRTQKILNKLPPKQKQCFILHYAYGYKYKEIAKKLSVSYTTVNTHIKRARKILHLSL